MSTLAIARARRQDEVVLAWTVCPHAGKALIADRYGNALVCGDCGEIVEEATPGRAKLDYDLACGAIDVDEYDERLDALLGHP